MLLGDGALRSAVESRIARPDLAGSVVLAGFRQYDELPAWYGLASAFVHASTTEQWGLVVNEAMASGLPVLVSNRCGCAPDLVEDGVNGFTFDPYDVEALAGLMQRVAAMTDERRAAMGRAGQRIIADWGPERFADGLMQAVRSGAAPAAAEARRGSTRPSCGRSRAVSCEDRPAYRARVAPRRRRLGQRRAPRQGSRRVRAGCRDLRPCRPPERDRWRRMGRSAAAAARRDRR